LRVENKKVNYTVTIEIVKVYLTTTIFVIELEKSFTFTGIISHK
jgi:hypothetical protein